MSNRFPSLGNPDAGTSHMKRCLPDLLGAQMPGVESTSYLISVTRVVSLKRKGASITRTAHASKYRIPSGYRWSQVSRSIFPIMSIGRHGSLVSLGNFEFTDALAAWRSVCTSRPEDSPNARMGYFPARGTARPLSRRESSHWARGNGVRANRRERRGWSRPRTCKLPGSRLMSSTWRGKRNSKPSRRPPPRHGSFGFLCRGRGDRGKA